MSGAQAAAYGPGMAVDRPHRPHPARRQTSSADAGRWARAALALLLAGSLTVAGSSEARPADAGVAPSCTYGDVLTRYRAQGDWYRSLLDTKYRLSSTSRPVDLVPVSRSGASGYGSIRRIALADLSAMYRAARAYGAPFAVTSAYRSYWSQVSTFNGWVQQVGYRNARLASARPGHSEHQLGTALDLKTPGGAEPWYYADWGQTRAGAWLRRNSWRYGWVMSYPKAKSPSATCYKYEPWHFRYVGRTIAASIRASTLAPREWLYLKGATGTWTGGPASPSPTPAPTASPSESPTPSASPSESPAPSDDPAASPTPSPTESPAATPTASPLASPGGSPGATPSLEPSASPGAAASESPLASSAPTTEPTAP
jgi:LAS superfamily LD-carboxypeptidase LdcB